MSASRDRIAKLQARRAETDAPPPDPVPAADPAGSGKKVRQTVDLSAERHAELAMWRIDAAVRLGRSTLSNQDTLRALVEVMLEDEATARRVRAKLERLNG